MKIVFYATMSRSKQHTLASEQKCDGIDLEQ